MKTKSRSHHKTKGFAHGGARPHSGKPKGYLHRETLVRELERVTQELSIAKATIQAIGRHAKDEELSAVRILEELRRVALVDMRDFWDGDTLKPVSQWTKEMGSAVSGMEAISKTAQAGDGHTDLVHKIKLWDKTKALELLAKHFTLLVEVQALVTPERMSDEELRAQLAAVCGRIGVTPVAPKLARAPTDRPPEVQTSVEKTSGG